MSRRERRRYVDHRVRGANEPRLVDDVRWHRVRGPLEPTDVSRLTVRQAAGLGLSKSTAERRLRDGATPTCG